MSEHRTPRRVWVQTTLATLGVVAVAGTAVLVGLATGPDPETQTTPAHHLIGTPMEGDSNGDR